MADLGRRTAEAAAGARLASAPQRTMHGFLLLKVQLGIRYCMAMASSRAPRPFSW